MARESIPDSYQAILAFLPCGAGRPFPIWCDAASESPAHARAFLRSSHSLLVDCARWVVVRATARFVSGATRSSTRSRPVAWPPCTSVASWDPPASPAPSPSNASTPTSRATRTSPHASSRKLASPPASATPTSCPSSTSSSMRGRSR